MLLVQQPRLPEVNIQKVHVGICQSKMFPKSLWFFFVDRKRLSRIDELVRFLHFMCALLCLPVNDRKILAGGFPAFMWYRVVHKFVEFINVALKQGWTRFHLVFWYSAFDWQCEVELTFHTSIAFEFRQQLLVGKLTNRFDTWFSVVHSTSFLELAAKAG